MKVSVGYLSLPGRAPPHSQQDGSLGDLFAEADIEGLIRKWSHCFVEGFDWGDLLLEQRLPS